MIDKKKIEIPDVFLERGNSEGNMSSHCSRAVAHTRRETVKGLFISLLIIPRRCRHLAPCGLSFCRHRHQGEDNRVSPGPGVRLPPPVQRSSPPPCIGSTRDKTVLLLVFTQGRLIALRGLRLSALPSEEALQESNPNPLAD